MNTKLPFLATLVFSLILSPIRAGSATVKRPDKPPKNDGTGRKKKGDNSKKIPRQRSHGDRQKSMENQSSREEKPAAPQRDPTVADDSNPTKRTRSDGGREKKSDEKPVKVGVREIASLAANSVAWIQGQPGNNSPTVAPFFGTSELKPSGNRDNTEKANSSPGLDALAILTPSQHENLLAAVERQRPLIDQFRAGHTRFMGLLNSSRNQGAVSLSKLLPVARELGTLESQVGLMQAEALAEFQLLLTDVELQRMQNIRSAYVNDYPATVSQSERDAALSRLAKLSEEDRRELSDLAAKSLVWLTEARPSADSTEVEKRKLKGSKTTGYLQIKSKSGGADKEAFGEQILTRLNTSQVRSLASAALSQANYQSEHARYREWLRQSLTPLKKGVPISDRRTFERVASELGVVSARLAHGQVKAFQSLSNTLTADQRRQLLQHRPVALSN
jgi:hypothetical protein